jgi:hypothetical protein
MLVCISLSGSTVVKKGLALCRINLILFLDLFFMESKKKKIMQKCFWLDTNILSVNDRKTSKFSLWMRLIFFLFF